MKTRTKKITTSVLAPSKEFEKIYEKWSRTKLELRTVTQRLQQAHQWLAVLTALRSDEEARKQFDKLRAHRAQLLKTLHQQQHRMKKFMPRRDRPGAPGGELPSFEPTREQLEQALLTKRILDRYKLGSLLVRPIFGQGESAPSPWTSVLWSSQLTEYPGIQWTHDPNATFSKTLVFSPSENVQLGNVRGKFWINNPAPLDWPVISEVHDWAQLMICAALSFDIPAPSQDSIVFYEAELILDPRAHDYSSVRDFVFSAQCLLFEQRNATTGAPQILSDFERLGNSIWTVPESPLTPAEHVSVDRQFYAPAGMPSKVHLGFTWNLSISSGAGGTMDGCWDNFFVARPAGSDIWGVKVTQVPLSRIGRVGS